MKHYRTRLRKAIQWKNYFSYYYEEEFPLVWELDMYILNLVRVNLPNYKFWHPADISEEDREVIRNKFIQLANDIYQYEDARGWRYKWGDFEAKVGFKHEDIDKKREEFADLLWDHLWRLRD